MEPLPDDFWADERLPPQPHGDERAVRTDAPIPAARSADASTPPVAPQLAVDDADEADEAADDAPGLAAGLAAGLARLQRLFPGTVLRVEPRTDGPPARADGDGSDGIETALEGADAAAGRDAVES